MIVTVTSYLEGSMRVTIQTTRQESGACAIMFKKERKATVKNSNRNNIYKGNDFPK